VTVLLRVGFRLGIGIALRIALRIALSLTLTMGMGEEKEGFGSRGGWSWVSWVVAGVAAVNADVNFVLGLTATLASFTGGLRGEGGGGNI
jgi:hypothetical protein